MEDSKPEGYSRDNGHGMPTHRKLKSGEWIATPDGYCRRKDGFNSHYWITRNGMSKWFKTPSMASLERMSDGISKTPWGDKVEPDHPESWLRILSLI